MLILFPECLIVDNVELTVNMCKCCKRYQATKPFLSIEFTSVWFCNNLIRVIYRTQQTFTTSHSQDKTSFQSHKFTKFTYTFVSRFTEYRRGRERATHVNTWPPLVRKRPNAEERRASRAKRRFRAARLPNRTAASIFQTSLWSTDCTEIKVRTVWR